MTFRPGPQGRTFSPGRRGGPSPGRGIHSTGRLRPITHQRVAAPALSGHDVSAPQLIGFAYDVPRVALVAGGPAWVDSDTFDVTATFEGVAQPAQVREMVRDLLVERFDLRAHQERREWPVYHLVLARDDGALGPKLRRSTMDCAAMTTDDIPCVMVISGAGARGLVRGGKRPWPAIVRALGSESLLGGSERIVVDKTGLAGDFDIDMQWVVQTLDSAPGDAETGQGVSFFTALQEQAGLKLVPVRDIVDVLVIDSIDRPTPN